ncbi:uncharacterized protein LOC141650268 [Silene latifolia]|uniref:uncharacterized protein LOC141650268 n=1 Tax=Silene latifolia TaxID=37657 RepID=UPI003D773081
MLKLLQFRDCVHYCGFNDIKGRGAFFTWNNKQAPATRGFSRIDRFLEYKLGEKKEFKYYNMWSMDPEFKNIVHQSWNCQINGTPMFKLVTKLKNIKKPLRMLNRNGFSDIGKIVVVAKALLEELQLATHTNPTDLGLLATETDATESYRQLYQS